MQFYKCQFYEFKSQILHLKMSIHFLAEVEFMFYLCKIYEKGIFALFFNINLIKIARNER